MQDYRVYILGPDDHVQSRVDLRCSKEMKPSSWQSNSQIVTTWSYGNSINTSRPSGARPSDR